MSTDSLPPPRRSRRQTPAASVRPRRPCACRAPLPPLPPGLLRRGLGRENSRQFIDWPNSLESVQVTPESLSRDAVGRLFARVQARFHRVQQAEARAAQEWFWIHAELALVLARIHPKARERCRRLVGYAERWAEWRVDHLRKLAALILAHEPEAERWLRRQLAELPPLGPS